MFIPKHRTNILEIDIVYDSFEPKNVDSLYCMCLFFVVVAVLSSVIALFVFASFIVRHAKTRE